MVSALFEETNEHGYAYASVPLEPEVDLDFRGHSNKVAQ